MRADAPDAHAVVSHHGAHSMVPRLLPLLFGQLQHLLKLLAQVAVSLGQQSQLAELTDCTGRESMTLWDAAQGTVGVKAA